ncbi:hypothetical protein MMC17_000086 [Xylographa soralifera]|nr:hypothetical protein [Xylographa soralifera]
MSSQNPPDGGNLKRAVRIANCSGANCDPGIHMLNQACYGDVDVITGDYLAEMNLAQNAEAMRGGSHPGYEPTALEGLTLSLDVIYEKRIKVIINGGALNPRALAERTLQMATERKLELKICYVSGDDLIDTVLEQLSSGNGFLNPLDGETYVSQQHTRFLENPQKAIVSAHAYLGARAIRKGLEEGADIIICGRVSDASPVIGAAQWWYGWPDTAYDELAGALVAGHLIECSTYSTGANFAGFDKYPIEDLLDLGLPIAEIDARGHCIVTKAATLPGIVTRDVIICQLLYELQGNIYLNSDVKADISNISVEQESENRVSITGVKGYPPPPTTKLAIYYRGGFQCEWKMNATGSATERKYQLQEAQVRTKLKQLGVSEDFETLEFQRCGIPEPDPQTQLASTTYLRIFAQAKEQATLGQLIKVITYFFMQHYSGMHLSLDIRTARPIPYLAYYPALVSQSMISERVTFLPSSLTIAAGHPPIYAPLLPREDYDPREPSSLSSFGSTRAVPLGDVALARSGDKGANINIGIFVRHASEWPWLRIFLTKDRLKWLMAEDWRDEYVIERVEFEKIWAVHFVIYGPLGRGVSSSARLDSLGKGFADFIRARVVDVPEQFL